MLHSAEGKIHKILVLANNALTLPLLNAGNVNPDSRLTVLQLPKTYEKFDRNHVNVFVAVKFGLELFAEFEDAGTPAQRAKFKGFIPVQNPNNESSDCSPASMWAQDVFDFAEIGGQPTLVYSDGCSFLYQQILQVIGKQQLVLRDDINFPKGGNLLFGGIGGVKYVISTIPEKENALEYEHTLKAFYKSLQPCILPNDFPTRLRLGFYHTDFYVSIGGIIPKINLEMETVFVAQAFSNVDQTALDAEAHLSKVRVAIQDFVYKSGMPIFLDSLPAYFVDSGDDCFVMSYNNCHVENYSENSQQVIRMYLPDYTNAIKEFCLIAPENSNKMNFLSEPEKMKSHNRYRAWVKLLKKLDIGPKIKTDEKSLMEDFPNEKSIEDGIQAIQTLLATNLKQKGIQAEFIDDGYRNMVRYFHGGLHCVSKVIERG